ncbi:hypothetical protein GZH47_13530 [Paenibacillus rhizovicinus]|uniref:Uncharacterized protein n=1 Tax=Paenibacillus rhizovicinus TaxID=2704463 RepID=A0A6C0NZX6_9BACL|nr:hypothetical protein [Paenibacillus rhizovicinus]QHW31759.1 hypothetical protein GZH47_13530 [Paenibacillus rhizovicinus]
MMKTALALLVLLLGGWLGSLRSNAAPDADWHKLQDGEAVSVQVVGSLHGITPSPLYTVATSEGRAIVATIVRWYNAAPPNGVQPFYGRHGYPWKLRIDLSDGSDIMIEQAYDCTTRAFSNHSEKSCASADGEVVFHVQSKELRGKNRELYDWLAGGWRTQQ